MCYVICIKCVYTILYKLKKLATLSSDNVYNHKQHGTVITYVIHQRSCNMLSAQLQHIVTAASTHCHCRCNTFSLQMQHIDTAGATHCHCRCNILSLQLQQIVTAGATHCHCSCNTLSLQLQHIVTAGATHR